MKFSALSPVQDRALHELRQGRPIALKHSGRTTTLWAVDATSQMKTVPGGQLLISEQRAGTLGLAPHHAVLPIDPQGGPDILAFLTWAKAQTGLQALPAPDFADDLIQLAKQGRLIPAFYLTDQRDDQAFALDQSDLAPSSQPPEFQRTSTVRLPIELDHTSIETTALLFSGGNLHEEALVLHVGDPHIPHAPLVRLHSACLTGDVFGSMRCDCGPQLHAALHQMDTAGAGCLLYMPQEGRDTGLSNKLRAYALQDAGLDTIDADATLGFDSDERDFAFAAALLRLQGLTRIRLMTNNPAKVSGLESEGIEVVERIPVRMKPGVHNAAYLKTKADRAGHDL